MISPCLSFKILSGVCNLLLSSTEYITVSQYINRAVAIVLQFDLEMPKLLYLPFLDGIVSTNLSACVYIYIYIILLTLLKLIRARGQIRSCFTQQIKKSTK